MSVMSIDESNWDVEVQQSEQPVVVDFFATWCAPCKAMGLVLDKLAERHAGEVKFVKVNIEEAFGLAQRFNIRAVPTLAFMKGGDVVGLEAGFMAPAQLEAKIRDLRQPANA